MRLTTSGVARWFYRGAPIAADVEPDTIVVLTRDGTVAFERADVRRLVAHPGWPWDSLRIEPTSGRAVTVRGLARGTAARATGTWQAYAVAPLAAATLDAFRALLARDAYVTRGALDAWRDRASLVAAAIPANLERLALSVDVRRGLDRCRICLADADRLTAGRNDEYVREKMHEHAAWFATAGGRYALTDEQQDAILRDEDNCLVVAGAGTGKTSTVAGKVGYLLRTGAARPEQILLLSFTRKAATEMAERIVTTVGADAALGLRATTFHALGVDILAHADGARPSLSSYAEDPLALGTAITGYLEALLTEPATRSETMDFLAYSQTPYRSTFDFATAHEYYQYLRDHELRTLQGELVRSHEELTIANWLYLHGIAYEYERAYEHDTATIQHRQYHPDFHLTDYGIYLEHFGVNRAGETASWVKRSAYLAEMAWKREVHQRFGTALVETYSWERMEGVLLQQLEVKLRAAGVVPHARSPEELLAAAKEQKMVSPIARLFASFLNLFKGNCWTLAEVEEAARSPSSGSRLAGDSGRAIAFLRVFRHILARYEAELAAARQVDFNDMIAQAVERVTSGRFTSPWTHVIVDEFQDLSRGRGRLLHALLAQVPDRRLFCVGDDWQSIYRFTGSDIEQMTTFGERFGFTRRCDLTRTHRFNAELLAASSTFVQRNPGQLQKSLRSERSLGGPALEILVRSPEESSTQTLDRALARITEHAEGLHTGAARPTVLLIGRYNANRPDDWGALARRHPALSLEFLTVHRSKGLEADYTVVLDVVSGRMGFPSETVDDPVLDIVLASSGTYPNAEERRVFYVALTRARHRCLILTDATKRSKFVEELERDAYRPWVATSSTGATAAPACLRCGGGRLIERVGKHGRFWGCANYPYCDAKARVCPACRMGALLKAESSYRCSMAACGHVAPLCPSCGIGMLVSRRTEFGSFLGCSEWRPAGAGPSCDYTVSQRGGRSGRERQRAT